MTKTEFIEAIQKYGWQLDVELSNDKTFDVFTNDPYMMIFVHENYFSMSLGVYRYLSFTTNNLIRIYKILDLINNFESIKYD